MQAVRRFAARFFSSPHTGLSSVAGGRQRGALDAAERSLRNATALAQVTSQNSDPNAIAAASATSSIERGLCMARSPHPMIQPRASDISRRRLLGVIPSGFAQIRQQAKLQTFLRPLTISGSHVESSARLLFSDDVSSLQN